MSTASGMTAELLCCQYHASGGRSYSASTRLPTCIPVGPSTGQRGPEVDTLGLLPSNQCRAAPARSASWSGTAARTTCRAGLSAHSRPAAGAARAVWTSVPENTRGRATRSVSVHGTCSKSVAIAPFGRSQRCAQRDAEQR
jgi:hypothetical protein